jgi:AP-3 complex subunit beta
VHTQLEKPTSLSQSHLSIISNLANKLEGIQHPRARACVIWLVGQYSMSSPAGHSSDLDGVSTWAPDVLRRMAKSFINETPAVKLQVLTLAAKLLSLCPADRNLGLMGQYVFSLGRFDLNYDVRDRARMLTSLLTGLVSPMDGLGTNNERRGVVLRKEQVKLVLFEGKIAFTEERIHGLFLFLFSQSPSLNHQEIIMHNLAL